MKSVEYMPHVNLIGWLLFWPNFIALIVICVHTMVRISHGHAPDRLAQTVTIPAAFTVWGFILATYHDDTLRRRSKS